MSTALVQGHIDAQAQLRAATALAVEQAWTGLGAYNQEDVARFLAVALPAVAGGQRAAAAVTNAFLAQTIGRAPLPLDVANLIGAAARLGTDPGTVYRRPFVDVWSALKNGTPYDQAVDKGRVRAESAAVTDVQLAMRETLREVGTQDELILGYARVPDAGACAFCKLVAGQRYTVEDLLPIHPRCGCGVDPIVEENRGDFTGVRANDLSVTRDGVTAAVREHGELGPVLVNGDDAFTSQHDF